MQLILELINLGEKLQRMDLQTKQGSRPRNDITYYVYLDSDQCICRIICSIFRHVDEVVWEHLWGRCTYMKCVPFPLKKKYTGVFCCSFLEPRIWAWLLVTHKTWRSCACHRGPSTGAVAPANTFLAVALQVKTGGRFYMVLWPEFVFFQFRSTVGEAISFGF